MRFVLNFVQLNICVSVLQRGHTGDEYLSV